MSNWDIDESGPFCRHWAEVGECDELCATCGHHCISHEYGYDEPFGCIIDDCECEDWVESE